MGENSAQKRCRFPFRRSSKKNGHGAVLTNQPF